MIHEIFDIVDISIMQIKDLTLEELLRREPIRTGTFY